MIDTESLPPKPKSRRRMILSALACVAAIVGGYIWYTRHGRESTDDAQIDADVVLVPARVGGFVTKVNFSENQRVKAGDVLAELDSAGLAAIRVGANVLHVGLRDARAGASVRVQLLARDVILATARPENISVRNVMTGTIARMTSDDAETDMIHVDIGGPLVLARVTRAASAALDLRQGKEVWVLVKAVSIRGHAYVRNPPPPGSVRKLTY